jgi:hypothetical protein
MTHAAGVVALMMMASSTKNWVSMLDTPEN